MEADNLTLYAPIARDWLAMAPEMALAVGGALLVVLGAFMRRHAKTLASFAIIMLLAILLAQIFYFEPHYGYVAFNGMVGPSTYTWIFILCGILSSVMGARWLAKTPAPHAGEFYGVLFLAIAALSVMSRSKHLMLTFVSLEASAVCFYVLIAWGRRQAANLESAVRYLVLSGASGAFLLLGIAFVYGASLKSGLDFLYYVNFYEAAQSRLFYAGMIFVLSGIFFKLSAFPFQFWSPDVYQGAPAPVCAFMAVASKAAAFTALFGMIQFMALNSKMLLGLCVVAAAGIIVGNLGGITERNAKRIIGFSGIANAGYLMVLLVALLISLDNALVDLRASETIIKFYLLAYLLGVYGVMFVQNLNANSDDSGVSFEDYRGMWGKSPISAGVLGTGLASLAGIPPTAGFFAKLLVIMLAVSAGIYWLALILVAGSVASIYYYFKWMRETVEKNADEPYGFMPAEASGPVMLALTIGSLCTGVFVFAFI